MEVTIKRSDDNEDEKVAPSKQPPTRSRRGKKPTRKCKAPSDELDDHLAAFVYDSLLPGHDLRKGCRQKVLDLLYENNSVGEYSFTGDIVWIPNLHKVVSHSVAITVPIVPLHHVATFVILTTL